MALLEQYIRATREAKVTPEHTVFEALSQVDGNKDLAKTEVLCKTATSELQKYDLKLKKDKVGLSQMSYWVRTTLPTLTDRGKPGTPAQPAAAPTRFADNYLNAVKEATEKGAELKPKEAVRTALNNLDTNKDAAKTKGLGEKAADALKTYDAELKATSANITRMVSFLPKLLQEVAAAGKQGGEALKAVSETKLVDDYVKAVSEAKVPVNDKVKTILGKVDSTRDMTKLKGLCDQAHAELEKYYESEVKDTIDNLTKLGNSLPKLLQEVEKLGDKPPTQAGFKPTRFQPDYVNAVRQADTTVKPSISKVLSDVDGNKDPKKVKGLCDKAADVLEKYDAELRQAKKNAIALGESIRDIQRELSKLKKQVK